MPLQILGVRLVLGGLEAKVAILGAVAHWEVLGPQRKVASGATWVIEPGCHDIQPDAALKLGMKHWSLLSGMNHNLASISVVTIDLSGLA